MTENPASEFLESVERFERRDRRRTLLATAFAVVIWIVVVSTSAIAIGRARSELATVEKESVRLTQRNAALERKFEELTTSAAQLRRENEELTGENARLREQFGGPLMQVVKPKMNVRRLPGAVVDGKPLYDIILFIDVPISRRDEIGSVVYEIDHPTKIDKSMKGTVAETGFAVGYRGYSCFQDVRVVVKPVVGAPFTIKYDMCKGWKVNSQK